MADDAGATQEQPAYRSARAWCVLATITIIGLAIDLVSKSMAFAKVADAPVSIDRAAVMASDSLDLLVPRHTPIVAIPRLLEFTLVLNPGAVFGVGAGQRWFFVGFTVLALGFAGWIFGAWTKSKDRWAHAAIGLIIAGGLATCTTASPLRAFATLFIRCRVFDCRLVCRGLADRARSGRMSRMSPISTCWSGLGSCSS